MMITAQQTPVFEYQYAKKVSDRVIEILTPYCDVIHIAGSICRQCTHVKDIEIVCMPKKVFKAKSLFGDGDWIVCDEFKAAIEFMKLETIKGTFIGRYMQVLLKGNIKLDLFMPVQEDYFRQLTIRTGSAEYSHKVIANRWAELGWCGTALGLRRNGDCLAKRNHEGKIVSWECINNNGEHPPVWTSEENFFEWLGIRWIEPRYR